MKKEAHILRFLALIIGIGIFIFTVKHFGGIEPVLKNLKDLKYFYALVILNSFLWMLSYTKAWKTLFDSLSEKIHYFHLLKVKLSGEGVNSMTPLGFIAGDPVRILLLKRYVGDESRLRAVVIDRALHSLSAQVFCLMGVLLIFTQKINFPLWLHVILLIVYLFLFTVLMSLIFTMVTGRGFGVFDGLIHLLKIQTKFPKVYAKLTELKSSLEYYKDRSKLPFFLAFVWHFCGRILGAVELMIVFYCLQGEVHFAFIIILTALTSFFSIAFAFIPGALGIVEALYAKFSLLYGFQPELGLTIQIVRRMRVLFWIGIGIVVLDYHEIARFFRKIRGKEDPSQSI